MLQQLKNACNHTLTENGAVTYETTDSDCLDFFATVGALRQAPEADILRRFQKAFAENADLAMKTLFFARDVRGGLGERRVFRTILRFLADDTPETVQKNLAYLPEYGRFDDLLVCMGTACEPEAVRLIREQLERDLSAEDTVSLLAKWLPSVNASNPRTIRNAKRLARALGMTDAQYRKCLVRLRKKIGILENNLREMDYSFDYAKQPSKAMFKYRAAFLRNDSVRYTQFLEQVQNGTSTLHTGALLPYEIIAPCLDDRTLSAAERKAIDLTWNALEPFGTTENALVVVDGSGSMYMDTSPSPAAVALSLGLYFASHNQGVFHDHFITFSQNPKLVQIKGSDIAQKVRYCAGFNEVANTDLERVFRLILDTACKHKLPQSELPQRLYIVSDMEFDYCTEHADCTNFEQARMLFASHGYTLPEIVFWNVASRNTQQPVTRNEQGVALVSGCTPRLFSMVAGGITSPYTWMLDTLHTDRYAKITA